MLLSICEHSWFRIRFSADMLCISYIYYYYYYYVQIKFHMYRFHPISQCPGKVDQESSSHIYFTQLYKRNDTYPPPPDREAIHPRNSPPPTEERPSPRNYPRHRNDTSHRNYPAPMSEKRPSHRYNIRQRNDLVIEPATVRENEN